MVNKMTKFLMGAIMLAAMTSAYASVINVTNKCDKVLGVAVYASNFFLDPCNDNTGSTQTLYPGKTVGVTGLRKCNFKVLVFSDTGELPLSYINFLETHTSHAEIVLDTDGPDGSCKPHVELK